MMLYVQLRLASEDLSAGVHTRIASALPSEPPSWPTYDLLKVNLIRR